MNVKDNKSLQPKVNDHWNGDRKLSILQWIYHMPARMPIATDCAMDESAARYITPARTHENDPPRQVDRQTSTCSTPLTIYILGLDWGRGLHVKIAKCLFFFLKKMLYFIGVSFCNFGMVIKFIWMVEWAVFECGLTVIPIFPPLPSRKLYRYLRVIVEKLKAG